MTKEDKELLLKDLCARLPYQPICEFTDTEDDFCTTTAALGYSLRDFIAGKVLIKPYLRPLSSMTEEEKIELYKIAGFYYFSDIELLKDEWRQFSDALSENKLFLPYPIWGDNLDKVYNWLNAHHFDYHGLIPIIALEASKDMFKNEEI